MSDILWYFQIQAAFVGLIPGAITAPLHGIAHPTARMGLWFSHAMWWGILIETSSVLFLIYFVIMSFQ